LIENRWAETLISKTIFLITGEFKKISTLKSKLKNSLFYKHKILILRIKSTDVDIDKILHVVRKFCKKNNIPLILNIPDKFKYKADGYHLQAAELNKKLSVSPNKILGASCHNKKEIVLAKELGCNYVFLSPIIKKYGSVPIGWNNFFKLRDEFSEMPVIPLGGVNEKNSMQESFAGISHWWDLQNF
tara:strand:- start:15 stop:575 length:561 start_codon:yes stop_codon:yes gene_type:complete